METKRLYEKNKDSRTCALCEKKVKTLSRHHLIPKEKGGIFGDIVELCQPCYFTIHYTFSNKEPAKEFNSIARLQQAERLEKYLARIRNKKTEKLSNRRKW